MNIAILTPIRLLSDGLERSLDGVEDLTMRAVTDDLGVLRQVLAADAVDAVLVDVTQPVDLEEIRAIAAAHPAVTLIALGLKEQRQEVIRCGRAGFAGYIARDASLDGVAQAIRDAVAGRLACPAEVSSGLLRALFRMDRAADPPSPEAALTRREGDVLQLIGRGLTNKEIARELNVSVATVKHHVHNVLEKLQLSRRAHAMRRVRDQPWLAP